jgi:hypothetical protein
VRRWRRYTRWRRGWRARAESPEQDATIIPRSDPDHFNAILDEFAATGLAMDTVATLRLPPEAYVVERTAAGVVVDGVPCGRLRGRLRQALAMAARLAFVDAAAERAGRTRIGSTTSGERDGALATQPPATQEAATAPCDRPARRRRDPGRCRIER